MLSFGPGAGRLNHFSDGCHRKAGAPSSDGGGRAAEKREKKGASASDASAVSPATPSRQDGHIRGSLPLISCCYVGQETHLHFIPALLASPAFCEGCENTRRGRRGWGGGVSVRDSSKLGPNLGHPAPLINQRTLSV